MKLFYNLMALCFSFLILNCSNNSEPKSINPFLQLDYDKVIAYDYEGGKYEKEYDIINDGKLASTVQQKRQLNPKQTKAFISFIGDSLTYGAVQASCFDPHLGVVFYKKDSVIAHLSICLECNYLHSSIEIPASKVKMIKIGENYEYPADGFSKLGRQKINTLCKELGFSHCIDSLNSNFD